MKRVATTVVVVALGDRKYVKLQRPAILMTPNDMPPSRRQRPVPADRPGMGEKRGFYPPPSRPTRARFANHQDWAPGSVEPVDPIHGIGIKNAITNWRRLIAIQDKQRAKCYKVKHRPREMFLAFPLPFCRAFPIEYLVPSIYRSFLFLLHSICSLFSS